MSDQHYVVAISGAEPGMVPLRASAVAAFAVQLREMADGLEMAVQTADRRAHLSPEVREQHERLDEYYRLQDDYANVREVIETALKPFQGHKVGTANVVDALTDAVMQNTALATITDAATGGQDG